MATSPKKKILVVDDEKDICIYLSRLFQENGFSVTCASNGDEALQAVEKDRPDLVTLDLSMPETTGVKFYRAIKSSPDLASIPVVFVTGVTGPGGPRDTEHFYSTRKQVPPPDGFVAKPIDPEEMLALAKKLTSGTRDKTATSSVN
jgi:CheY-like chemotaxis protein